MEIIDLIKNKIQYSQFYIENKYLEKQKITEFPIIDKQIVLKNYEKISCLEPNLLHVYTSGSNGIPMKIMWRHNEYMSSMATLWKLRKANGVLSTDYYLTCHALNDIHGKGVESPILITKNYLSLSKLCFSDEILQEFIKYINLLSPAWIYAQPSFVYYLGTYMKQYTPELINKFKYIELVGELLQKDIYDSIQKIFQNAKIINMYGMQEFNGIMYENQGVLQGIYDNVFIEILNEDGNPCKYDEEGDIVISGLKNSVFPLIRYRTGDKGKRIKVEANDGYVITRGRSNDELWYAGKRYDGAIFFSVVNQYNKSHQQKILKFQVIYDNVSFIFKVSVLGNQTSDNMMKDIYTILYKSYNIDIPVKIHHVQHEDEYVCGGGKIKYFINNSTITE